MQRDKAEEVFGFRLYQGGTIPGKEIRVVDMGDWDVEACGGTHLSNTSETGLIKILSSERIQDGVERLVYSVGPYALEEVQRRDRILIDSSEILGTSIDKIIESIKIDQERTKSLKIQLERFQQQISQERAEKLIKGSKKIGELKLVYFSDDVDLDFLIELGNNLERFESNIIAIMFSKLEGRSAVKAGREAVKKGIHAGKLASKLGQLIGGRGGGAPYFGQGGGGNLEKFNNAYEFMKQAVLEQLN
jgi:alanyl-tRNA synthetase